MVIEWKRLLTKVLLGEHRIITKEEATRFISGAKIGLIFPIGVILLFWWVGLVDYAILLALLTLTMWFALSQHIRLGQYKPIWWG